MRNQEKPGESLGNYEKPWESMRNQDCNSEKLGKNQKETKTKPKETMNN